VGIAVVLGVRPASTEPPPSGAAPQKGLDYTNSIGMKFKWIEPGSFLMGSPDGTTPPGAPAESERGDDERPHQVTLTKGFHMGVYLVTQSQWERVMGKDANHSNFMGKTDEEKKKLPVDTVSCDDCEEFCRKLSALEGRNYTLPTEAQWEYACRAGTSTPFWWGDTISAEQANYDGTYTYGKGGKTGEYRRETTRVDFFKPNPWGLYDMHGNLYQWCADYYDPTYYNNSPNKDPENLLKSNARVLRGGSWHGNPRNCRSAYRIRNAPGRRDIICGCRVALCLD
jgi:formylglycine-generating enzyme required for sulfatase activity